MKFRAVWLPGSGTAMVKYRFLEGFRQRWLTVTNSHGVYRELPCQKRQPCQQFERMK